jgi:hypothetical protein
MSWRTPTSDWLTSRIKSKKKAESTTLKEQLKKAVPDPFEAEEALKGYTKVLGTR